MITTVNGRNGCNVVNIYFNNNYRQYLLGWDYIGISDSLTATGEDVLLDIRNTGNNYVPQSSPPTYTPADPDTVLLQFQQSITAPWAFCSLSKIQITSSIPVAFPTLTALPLSVSSGQNNNTNAILQDFLVNYSSGGASSFSQPISYSPALDRWCQVLRLSCV